MQIVDKYCACRENTSECIFTCFYIPYTILTMFSPLPSIIVNVPTILNDASPKQIDPAILIRIGSITYNWDNSYDFEWKSISEFNIWLSHKQVAYEIKIQQ